MTDDKTRQLENRIETLESTIEKMMPSRRDALKMGGAALVGGSLVAGSASAGTNQVGTIGSASQLVDIESEDINAISVNTDVANINNFSTVLEKSTDQSISADTDTTVEWDNQDVDTNIFSYDASTNELTVLESGDYRVDIGYVITGVTDRDNGEAIVFVNGSSRRRLTEAASGSIHRHNGSILVKGVSANDVLRIDFRTDSNGNIFGATGQTWAMVSKEA